MSKTSELMENIVTDKFKLQTNEANSNIYLTAYSFIIGVIFLHLGEIFSSFKAMFENSQNIFYLIMGVIFALMLFMGSCSFLLQCLRINLPKADKFSPNLEICKYEFEERTNLLAGEISQKQIHSEKIDVLISEIIRLRLIGSINEATKDLQYYNGNKRLFQRITGVCLLMAAFMGGQAIITALPLGSKSVLPSSNQQAELPMSRPNGSQG